MQKILITGGAGFVGRHFCKYFLDRGDQVHCVDPVIKDTGGIEPAQWPIFDPLEYKNFYYYKQDCRDYFKEHLDDDFDYSLHLAAMVGGRMMIENNPLAVASDLSIDSEYWRWALKARPKKTVCFSSSAAYPIGLQRKDNYCLLKEDMISFGDSIGQPDMSYGWAKLTCEYLAILAYEKYGLKSVIYRPFSGYGEDQDDNYPFPSICKRALNSKDQKIFQVWGTGDQLRDFIHIDDCVRGVITTMDQINDAQAINLSTGILTSFKEFAAIATEACGYKPRIVGMSEKPSGVFARGGDTAKQHALGFVHSIDFKIGITRALGYYQENNIL
jgi:nucleoside-diphosphate-sugar epimerase